MPQKAFLPRYFRVFQSSNVFISSQHFFICDMTVPFHVKLALKASHFKCQQPGPILHAKSPQFATTQKHTATQIRSTFQMIFLFDVFKNLLEIC